MSAIAFRIVSFLTRNGASAFFHFSFCDDLQSLNAHSIFQVTVAFESSLGLLLILHWTLDGSFNDVQLNAARFLAQAVKA